jgi:hypothetical protein
VDRNKILLLAIASSFALLLILEGFYPFDDSNANLVQAQMMPTEMPTSIPTVPPANNNLTIDIFLITVIAIATIAVILYLAYSRKQNRQTEHAGTTHVYTSKTPQTQSQNVSEEEGKPFEVFLCYKKSSGKDYADHLKTGLEEIGLHTFEDCKDIPQTVDAEEGWARVRDKALEESKYFVLIMTPGFNLSSEVVKEIAMARKQANKTFVFFRHRSMGRNIVVDLGNEIIDIGKLEQVSFETKEELLRLAHNILLKPKPP